MEFERAHTPTSMEVHGKERGKRREKNLDLFQKISDVGLFKGPIALSPSKYIT
jgi:hypothetical protein